MDFQPKEIFKERLKKGIFISIDLFKVWKWFKKKKVRRNPNDKKT